MRTADPEMPKRPGKQAQQQHMGVTTFRLRPEQLEWLISEATARHTTANEYLRQILDREMEARIKT